MKNTLFVFLVLITLSSCGKKSKEDSTAPVKATVALSPQQNSANFLQELTKRSQFKAGQKKSYMETYIDKKGCLYYNTVKIEILSSSTKDSLKRSFISTHEKADGQPSSCSNARTYNESHTKTFSIKEITKSYQESIDHKRICKEYFKDCTSSKIVSIEDANLKNIPTKLFKTEYLFSDNTTYMLSAWISKNNLFEGMLAFDLVDKKSSKLIKKRVLIKVSE